VRGLLADPGLLIAGITVALAAFCHVLVFSGANMHAFVGIFTFIIHLPGMLFVEPHPLVDPTVTPVLLSPLMLLGLLLLARFSPVRLSLLSAVVLLGLASWAFCFAGPGVRLLFRATLLALSTVLAGVGLAAVLGAARRLGRWAVAAVGTMALAALAVGAHHGLTVQAQVDPMTQELGFLEQVLPRLPAGTTLVVHEPGDLGRSYSETEPKPQWIFPRFLLSGLDVRVVRYPRWRRQEGAGCTLYYRGLLCHTLTSAEGLLNFGDIGSRMKEAEAALEAGQEGAGWQIIGLLGEMLTMLVNAERRGLVVPPEVLARARAVCRGAEGVTGLLYRDLGTELRLPSSSYMPNVVYPADNMRVGFYRTTPDRCP